jgi:hypothetical protein
LKEEGSAFEMSVVVVVAWFTVSASAEEVLTAKFASPEYAAVTECDPVLREESASRALPPEIAAVPTAVAPSKNVIEPVGLEPEPACTLAENVTV